MNELKLQKALGDLIDIEIGLYLNDCQFVEGFLLDVKPDHIVVDVNKTVFYFSLQHIQAISSNAKSFLVSTEIVHYLNKNYLEDVLKALRYYWVSINSLSDRGHFGVLSKISDDYVTVINNSELLYVPKSFISNITSYIPEKQIIQINKREQIKFEDCQIGNQSTTEHTKETNEIERITNIEVPTLEVSSRKVPEDENVANEKSEDHLKTRLEVYATLVKLLKQNILNRDVDDERQEDIIQGLITHPNDEEEKGQTDTSVVEIQDYQVEKQVIVEHPQPINENKSIKNTEFPILEASVEEETELENVTQETPKILSRLVKPNYLGVLESNNGFSLEKKFIPTKSKAKRKKMPLPTWSTMNHKQDSITNPNNIAGDDNKLPDYGGGTKKLEQFSDPDNLLVQPVCDQYPNDDFGTVDEKYECAEITASQLPINPKEVKKMLEKQYLSLMKHAETNVLILAKRRLNLSEEAQYLALLRHAENMCRELKN